MAYADPAKQRAYQAAWIAKRRAAFLEGKTCAICGGVSGLEVDHLDPAEKVDHKVWSWAAKRREAELAKCQVLCRACHQEKTTAQTYPRRKHGTLTMYKRGGCRCDACRGANAEYERRRKHG